MNVDGPADVYRLHRHELPAADVDRPAGGQFIHVYRRG